MDQAISFLTERGEAMMIEFNPIRPTKVQFPNGMVFVISNTLVQARKAAFASFNERVVECRLAAQVIAKHKGLEWKKVRKLVVLQEELKLELSEMEAVVAVSLVVEDKVEAFLATVANEFYENDESRKPHLTYSLFKTKPGPGAALCDLTGN